MQQYQQQGILQFSEEENKLLDALENTLKQFDSLIDNFENSTLRASMNLQQLSQQMSEQQQPPTSPQRQPPPTHPYPAPVEETPPPHVPTLAFVEQRQPSPHVTFADQANTSPIGNIHSSSGGDADTGDSDNNQDYEQSSSYDVAGYNINNNNNYNYRPNNARNYDRYDYAYDNYQDQYFEPSQQLNLYGYSEAEQQELLARNKRVESAFLQKEPDQDDDDGSHATPPHLQHPALLLKQMRHQKEKQKLLSRQLEQQQQQKFQLQYQRQQEPQHYPRSPQRNVPTSVFDQQLSMSPQQRRHRSPTQRKGINIHPAVSPQRSQELLLDEDRKAVIAERLKELFRMGAQQPSTKQLKRT